MNRRALLLGVAMWAIPFVVSVLAFPFHEPNRALFESIMAVTVTASAVGLALVYFRKRPAVPSKSAQTAVAAAPTHAPNYAIMTFIIGRCLLMT